MSITSKANPYKHVLASYQPSCFVSESTQKLLQKRQQAHNSYIETLRQAENVKQELDKIDRLVRMELEDQQSFKRTPQIAIDAIDMVPLKYVSYYMHRKLDLPRLLNDLQAGQNVPGVHLDVERTLKTHCN